MQVDTADPFAAAVDEGQVQGATGHAAGCPCLLALVFGALLQLERCFSAVEKAFAVEINGLAWVHSDKLPRMDCMATQTSGCNLHRAAREFRRKHLCRGMDLDCC